MYLVIKTSPNGEFDSLTECAVMDLTQADLDRLARYMAKASQVSVDLEKDVTLAWSNWDAEAFESLPQEEDGLEMDMGEGWRLLPDHPFPEGCGTEPVQVVYSEMRVSATAVGWWYAPEDGSGEEYTYDLTVAHLAAIRAQLIAAEGEMPYGA